MDNLKDYNGEIVSLNISVKKGTIKLPVNEVVLKENHGILGDAHSGDWHRQISLLDISSIDKMKSDKITIEPGNFAENITTYNLELHHIPVGSLLKISDTVLELTQIGKECHKGCEIRTLVGDCVMPREGIFAKVIKGGIIKIGDKIGVEVK